MSRRGDNIHKRKDGRWEGRYKTGINSAGKTKYQSVYGKTYGEVKSKIDKLKKTNLVDVNYTGKDYKFSEVLSMWQKTNQIKHKGATEAKYGYLIEKHILPDLGNIKLSQISTLLLSDYMNKKLQNGRLDNKGGLSSAYVRSLMIIISSALQFAVNEQLCLPLKTSVYKPTSVKKEVTVLDQNDQIKLETLLYNNKNFTNLGILISLNTGLRIGEICALTWDDIDLKEGIIHVRTTVARVKSEKVKENSSWSLIIDKPKTRTSIRDIPISQKLLNKLKNMHQISKSQYVISENKSFVNPRTYEYRYHKILKTYGIDRINYHVLRHTFATRCIEAGVDVKSLSEMLGHSNVSITLNTYVHSSMEQKRKQIEKMSNFYYGQFYGHKESEYYDAYMI